MWATTPIYGPGFLLYTNFEQPTYIQMAVRKNQVSREISFLRYNLLILDKVTMNSANVIFMKDPILWSVDNLVSYGTIAIGPDYVGLAPYKRNGGYSGSCFSYF